MKRRPHLELLWWTARHIEFVYKEQQSTHPKIELVRYDGLHKLLQMMVRSLQH